MSQKVKKKDKALESHKASVKEMIESGTVTCSECGGRDLVVRKTRTKKDGLYETDLNCSTCGHREGIVGATVLVKEVFVR